MPIKKNRSVVVLFALLCAFLSTASIGGFHNKLKDQHQLRNFDRRVKHNVGFQRKPGDEQINAQNELRKKYPELKIRFNKSNGGARSVINPSGYLSEPSPSLAPVIPVDLALSFIKAHLPLFRLTRDDLDQHQIRDQVFSKITGTTHVYAQQYFSGIPVFNGQFNIGVDRDGRIISVNNTFVPELNSSINITRPKINAKTAIKLAALNLGIDAAGTVQDQRFPNSRNAQFRAFYSILTQQEITGQLMWLPIRDGDVRLVWNIVTYGPNNTELFELNIDAISGVVWTRLNLTNQSQFHVYQQPAESPNHVDSPLPLPPGDGRSFVIDPENSTASPQSWFNNSSGTMAGNNVHACINADTNNSCDFPEPTCDPLDASSFLCNFAIDLTSSPSNSRPAAVTNLFYWNNLIHDIHYFYGFDEQAGNFQENNFGKGGSGSDSVNAHAQDGSGTCNARFTAPPDGSNPRMEMFICGNASPARDGSLDNGVIVHEYGHGITSRLVGGPSTVSCLGNDQQPGEGWSDLFALVYTAKEEDRGIDSRGVATYLFGQPANGPGIRSQPYSTDQNINNFTYASISGMSVPHGVGSVWAQALWEVYWALIDRHGFHPDLSNPNLSWAGNHRALFYVTEGLKNTACSPTFLDARDGIIAAVVDAQNTLGAEDFCIVWQAFADFGLGVDASTPGSNSTSATNGFSVPVECQCSPRAIADAGPDQTICLGQSATIGTPALANTSYSWSPGGQTSAKITNSPLTTTTYALTATTACGSDQDQVTVFVDDGSSSVRLDQNFENDVSGWTSSGLWHLVDNSTCINPGYASATKAFAYTQDSSCNYSTGSANSGTLTSPMISGISATSTLSFQYFRQVESYAGGSYDKTDVEIVTSNGATTVWSRDSTDASSNNWTSITPIDLSDYAGQTIQIRFRFNSVDGVANSYGGWYIDDVVVTGESPCSGVGAPEPSLIINSPADNSEFTEGVPISFSGIATDTEDGDLSASINWSLNADGSNPFGQGASAELSTLSVGQHTIYASVTDSGGLTASASVTVTINANTEPTVSITAPSGNLSFIEGAPISFSGTATDTEDGDLSASINWSLNADGSNPFGQGASAEQSTLSVGQHTIYALVTDSGGLTASASVTVTVNANTEPTVSITAPSGNLSFIEGAPISFSGTAADTEDGDLSASINWSLNADGSNPFGEGASAELSTLSVGQHTIYASVTDSGGLTAFASVTVTVNANAEPTVSIDAPAGGSTFTEGQSITFSGTATDNEDGDLSAQIAWSYTTNGSAPTAIGTGASVGSALPVGTHTVTATITDSGGKSATDSISVTVNANPSTCNYPAWICRLLGR